MGKAGKRRARRLIVIGEDGRLIAESARRAGFDAIDAAASMDEAVRAAATCAVEGDVVLLAPACASFDWYTSFEQRGAAFKEAVARLQREA